MSKRQKEKNLNYGIFSPKFETCRHLKLGKSKIQNSKYFQSLLGSPTNFNSYIKYSKNKSTYFSPVNTNGFLSPIRKIKTKLKKSSSQKNITERPLCITSRCFPTVMNNFKIIRSPIYKTTNNNIFYNTSLENKNNYFNLETEKLYQETKQIKKLVKYLINELLELKKENEQKDKEITKKEKQINDIIIKNNSLLIGTESIHTDDIKKLKTNEYTSNASYITNKSNNTNNKTEDNSYSNIYNDSIYINALSSNRNSSTGNLFFKIKKEIKKTNNIMKLENDRYEKLKKSLYATKMNELTVESNLLQTQINKLNSLLENALIIKRNNDQKNEEYTKIKENLEKQEKIKNNLTGIITKLENEENDLRDKLELNEYKLNNKIKEMNMNINQLIILKKKNENLNKDKVIKGELYTTINKINGNPVHINSIYKNKIKELKKSIKFYERQVKFSEDELNKLKEKRKKLIDTEKIKGLKINLDINNKERDKITIITNKNVNNNNNLLKKETEEEKINKLKEKLRETKAKEKTMEEKLERYTNKLRELELIEEEKERQKEEMNNQNQSQIEFGIDNENPFYTEEEGNIPEISLKFTSSQFNQFTYVLFKNFEAKGIVEDEAKNKIINIFCDYMEKNNIYKVEYNSIKFKEIMEEFTKIIMKSLNNNNTYNYTLTNIFISALFFNSDCSINKLIKYFNILFSYTRNYSIDEGKFLEKLRTKYINQTKTLINCVKDYIDSEESDNKEYFPLLKMKEILDKNKINLKDKYIEFLFYYLKKFDDPDTKLVDLKFDLLKNILPIEKEVEIENSENNNLNSPIKDSEIKDINNSNKNDDIIELNTSKKEESNILDLLDKGSNINLTSQKNEMKSPTEEDFSKRQKKKKKEMDKKAEKKEKKEEKENSEEFEEEEDSMTEITNEEYIKQLTEAIKIMEKGMKEKNITFEKLMSNVVQKRKITGIFYECISIEDFNEQFKNIDIVLSDLKLSCLCSKYSIPNELRLIDKNKIFKDIEKQEKGILKFDEDEEDDDDDN